MTKNRIIGIGPRNYNYERLVYGLPVEGVEYVKGAYVPWNRLGKNPRLQNTYYFVPYPKFDLLHLWNGVLLNKRPFVTSFESWLPRVFDSRHNWHYKHCLARLMSEDCRKLFAMSDFARNFFLWQNRGEIDHSTSKKVEVLYGGVSIPDHALEQRLDRLQRKPEGALRVCLIGHEFFRKGGLPTIRAFERLARELPNLKLVVVSRLQGLDYVSHETRSDEARTVLQRASWAEWHESLPHQEVMRLIEGSDVGLLPSLDDTFGWSTLEAMSQGLPVVGTNICALPEIIVSNINGMSIPIDLAVNRRWIGFGMSSTDPEFKEIREATYQKIEDGLVANIRKLANSKQLLEKFSINAVEHVRKNFDPNTQGAKLTKAYREFL